MITPPQKNEIQQNRINSQIVRNQRSSSFELLRIVCILFIVAGHMFMGHDWADNMLDSTIKIGLRPMFSVGVNCFVLISGWFGIKLNWRKLRNLNSMVTFWTITLGVFAIVLGLHAINLRKDILLLLPVLTKQYWFITIYFVLCVISPALNILVEHIEKDAFKKLLIAMFILFVALPTIAFILNFESITNDAGYGIVNFVFLYLLGRYLRLHYVSKYNKYTDLAGYFSAVILCGVVQIAISKVLGFEFTSFGSYDTIFIFFGAVFLFMFFSKLNFKSRVVNWMATFCLATYIIHLHPWIFAWLYQDFLGGNTIQGFPYLIFICAMPFITFAACIALESVRQFVFKCAALPFKD